MVFFKLIVLLFSVIEFTYGDKFRCDYTYSKQAKGWLKVHKNLAIWTVAQQTCQNEGATIALLPLKTAMLDIMQNSNVGVVLTADTQVTDCSSGCKLLSLTSIERAPRGDNMKRHFICFYAAEPSLKLTECGTVDSSYKLNKHTKTCHKFHTSLYDWEKAKKTCKDEGANLVVINDEEEAKILKDLMKSSEKPALVGFSANKTKDFYTVENTKLNYVYHKFGENNDGELCGAIDKNHQLTTVKCDAAYEFFCEKNVANLACDDNGVNFSTTNRTPSISKKTAPLPSKSSAAANDINGLILMLLTFLFCFISIDQSGKPFIYLFE